MNFRNVSIAAAIAVCATSSSHASDPQLAADAKAFGARETTFDMDISPSGRFLLEKAAGKGRESLIRVIDIQTGAMTSVIGSIADPEKIDWCSFETDSELVCRYSALVPYQDSIIGFSRLISVSTDGKQIKDLGEKQRSNDTGIRQFAGNVVDWLADEPGNILMARTYVASGASTGTIVADKRAGLGVDRVDVATGKVQSVEPPRGDAEAYWSDGRGNVRLMRLDSRDKETGMLTGAMQFMYRLPGSRDWRMLGEYRSSAGTGMYPLAIDGDSNTLYYLEKTNGRDALYRMALDGSMKPQFVAVNDKVDISSVVRLGRGPRVIGYSYVDDRQRVVYFDPEYSALATALGRAIPNLPVISFESASADGKTLLIHASSDTNPGAYYLFDKTTKKLSEVGLDREQLADRPLAPVKTVSVPGPGGAQIPAYLTLPLNRPGTNLPAVVLPHGGPSARDIWGFDWLAQFLAARGYAVIQPNYRGSAGYGDDWLGDNAIKGWKTAIGDISASADYLVKSGIADPKRLAILGWSYGGYAALQSAVVEPHRYNAVVAIAPVTDFALMKRQYEGFTNAELVKDEIGNKALSDGSPLRNAAKIEVPVLLFHGDMDANVYVEQSDKMAKALQGGNGKVEYVRYKGLDHQLDDSDARIGMLTKIGEFLDSSIGQ